VVYAARRWCRCRCRTRCSSPSRRRRWVRCSVFFGLIVGVFYHEWLRALHVTVVVPAPERALIEDDVTRYVHVPFHRVVDAVAFAPFFIANEGSLLPTIFECGRVTSMYAMHPKV
jgi:hypothetical protein